MARPLDEERPAGEKSWLRRNAAWLWTAFEERYRNKGSIEQAAKDLEAAIATTADKIAALVPGLTWKWHRDGGNIGCPQDPAADTRVTRFATRHVLFSGPIPEEAWPTTVAIVRSEAEFWGMTAQFKYQDAAKQHDLVFSSEDGGEISFGTAVQAVITGKTPCRLMEHWHTDRGPRPDPRPSAPMTAPQPEGAGPAPKPARRRIKPTPRRPAV